MVDMVAVGVAYDVVCVVDVVEVNVVVVEGDIRVVDVKVVDLLGVVIADVVGVDEDVMVDVVVDS